MKKKDTIALVMAVVILLAAGYLAYSQFLAPKSKTGVSGTTVDVIGSIPSGYDQTGLNALGDPTKVKDFTPALDLTTGLNNTAPFGQ